jgi:hypothetical protein
MFTVGKSRRILAVEHVDASERAPTCLDPFDYRTGGRMGVPFRKHGTAGGVAFLQQLRGDLPQRCGIFRRAGKEPAAAMEKVASDGQRRDVRLVLLLNRGLSG